MEEIFVIIIGLLRKFFIIFIFKFNFIEVYLIYNVVLVSGVQHSDSVYIYIYYIYTYIYIFFQILFPYRLLQNTEYNSPCYTVGPFWLPILDRKSVV